MSDINITWEYPPMPSKDRNKWDTILSILKANPGRWACIFRDAYSDNISPLRVRGCEVATRAHSASGRCDIYARRPEGK